MSLLGMTTAIILVASSGTTSLETTATTDAARIATNAGFLLGNAHRCGVATDRVVKAGQTIRELIKATAKDDKEQQEATDRFATFFLLTALPDDGDSKLVASCPIVSSEFEQLEQHNVDTVGANIASGGATSRRFSPGDGE